MPFIEAAFFGDQLQIDLVYSPEQKIKLKQHCTFRSPSITLNNFHEYRRELEKVQVIFSTWTMPRLENYHLDMMPNLKAVFFAAGSVKSFAEPLWDRGIIIVSAWKVNAIPTAEFTFAQILLSMKGTFRNRHEFRSPEMISRAFRGPGNCEEYVALLGMGAVGRHVVKLLRQTDVRILACDPYVSSSQARELGVEMVELEEAFSLAFVVSNHIPQLPETIHLIRGRHFESMRIGATFVNTARGNIINEMELIEVLRRRPDLQAILDVTDPEPPAANSPLFSLPNVFMTTHLAGATNNEAFRLGRVCFDEFLAWKSDSRLEHAVPVHQFARMA